MLIGLIGKPSVGKSTFFKAATLAEVEIASYPFTTIKANHGVGYIRIECIDKEFNLNGKPAQCNPRTGFCINHQRFVPIDLMDVAGLVEGASEGKGLGNQFLDDLRGADIFIHIVDISGKTDKEGKVLPENENHNPCEDVLFLEKELDKWYYNILMKVWRSFARKTEIEKTKFSEGITKQFSGLRVNEEHVKEVLLKLNFPEKASTWTNEQLMEFASGLRKTSKPMIIAANKCDEKNALENLKKLKEKFPDYIIIPCSADSELALRQAAKSGLIEYIPGDKDFKILTPKGVPSNKLKDVSEGKELSEKQILGLEKIKKDVLEKFEFCTGVQKILNLAVLDLLGYIAVFPASATKLSDSKGNVLPDCFLMPPNSTALDFAYHLHTDFGKNFIKAIDARSKMAWGKEHKLKNRDALEIVTR